jgi:hypothetical protein
MQGTAMGDIERAAPVSDEAAPIRASHVWAGAAARNADSGPPASNLISRNVGLALVLTIGGALLVTRLHNGWFPHDEGVLGQSAERVLAGELPHRDFDEIYTGMLSYLHAAAFKLMGIGSQTMRLPLFVAALVWQFAFYRIALRAMAPLAAAVVTLLAMVWSVPNYPAGMPSWYNLFCATWGLLALLRWVEDGRVRWLVLAGLAGGISFLFKLTGIFFLAGGAVAITAITATRRADDTRHATLRFANAVATAAYAAVGLVLGMVMMDTGASSVTRFALPIALLCGALIAREWRQTGGTGMQRVRDVTVCVGAFLGGAAIPVMGFFAWFAANDGLASLIEGVFVVPFRRVDFAQVPPPTSMALLAAVPVAWLLWPRQDDTAPRWSRIAALTAAALALIVVVAGTDPNVYKAVWYSAWSLPFLAALAGAVLAVKGLPATGSLTDSERNGLLAVCIIAVFALLVEYPFAAAIYTLYALPLSILAVAMMVRSLGRTPAMLQYTVIAFFLVLGVARILPNDIAYIGHNFLARDESGLLEAERGRLWMRPIQAHDYGNVLEIIEQNREGRTIWAGPDAPEIYFFSGARNPTRTMFDFFDAQPMHSRLAEHVQNLGVGMVVLNLFPGFSPQISEETLVKLLDAYPNHRRTYKFLVLWQ